VLSPRWCRNSQGTISSHEWRVCDCRNVQSALSFILRRKGNARCRPRWFSQLIRFWPAHVGETTLGDESSALVGYRKDRTASESSSRPGDRKAGTAVTVGNSTIIESTAGPECPFQVAHPTRKRPPILLRATEKTGGPGEVRTLDLMTRQNPTQSGKIRNPDSTRQIQRMRSEAKGRRAVRAARVWPKNLGISSSGFV
jgi:hypothetical protein